MTSAKKGLEHLDVLVGFFVGRQMAALLKKYDLRAGDDVGHAPRREWRDVHVVAASNDESGKTKFGQLCGEVKVGRRLLNCARNGGYVAEVAHPGDVGVAPPVPR